MTALKKRNDNSTHQRRLVAAVAVELDPSRYGRAYERRATSSPTTITVTKNATWGSTLTLKDGDTLYRLTKDSTDKSVCTGKCATVWIPVVRNRAEDSRRRRRQSPWIVRTRQRRTPSHLRGHTALHLHRRQEGGRGDWQRQGHVGAVVVDQPEQSPHAAKEEGVEHHDDDRRDCLLSDDVARLERIEPSGPHLPIPAAADDVRSPARWRRWMDVVLFREAGATKAWYGVLALAAMCAWLGTSGYTPCSVQ